MGHMNSIIVNAYWQIRSAGTKISEMNLFYVRWLNDNIGEEDKMWEGSFSDFHSDNLEFRIHSKFNAAEVEKTLNDLALLHVIKYGAERV